MPGTLFIVVDGCLLFRDLEKQVDCRGGGQILRDNRRYYRHRFVGVHIPT